KKTNKYEDWQNLGDWIYKKSRTLKKKKEKLWALEYASEAYEEAIHFLKEIRKLDTLNLEEKLVLDETRQDIEVKLKKCNRLIIIYKDLEQAQTLTRAKKYLKKIHQILAKEYFYFSKWCKKKGLKKGEEVQFQNAVKFDVETALRTAGKWDSQHILKYTRLKAIQMKKIPFKTFLVYLKRLVPYLKFKIHFQIPPNQKKEILEASITLIKKNITLEEAVLEGLSQVPNYALKIKCQGMKVIFLKK
ncbi:MAG: hypothetical protein D6785_13035, partial [Planctomycetota bacterium]